MYLMNNEFFNGVIFDIDDTKELEKLLELSK
jgi:hypothetical protein